MKPPDSARLTAGQAVRAALSSSVKRLLDHEKGVLAGRDPEALHQARVAVRRLRSDLRSLRPLLDRNWSARLRQELRWLGTEFGAVRDLDVLLQRLRSDAERIGAAAEGDPGVKSVLGQFRAERASLRKKLVVVMRSERYKRLRDRIVSAARAPQLTLASRLQAVDAFEPIVRVRWKRLRRAVEDLSPRPAALALHRIRILAKRCRYVAEAAEAAVGEEARRFAKAAANLQDALGELNDAQTACAKLRRLRRNPEIALSATALLALEGDAAARARAAWVPVWRELDDKRLRSWF